MKKLIVIALAVFSSWSAGAQQMPSFPMDPAVRYGKLENGLTYYIRHNEEPKDRASFYIAQKVGAVQEDDNQRGLAHFLEHMCFNGTQNFPGNKVVEYCESIGVKFGQNLNAYTAADETVYNINDVPTTSKGNIDSCLLILHDWADGLLLETAEIDKERGVIHEEWRMRSSATQRILERNLPKLYPGSKYGHRMPIGLMEVVDNFKPEVLRAYYEKWYRPDLQGIVVVGDLDVDYVEGKIKEMFGSIKMPENPAPYEMYPVPGNKEPIYVIDKDKEQQSNIVELTFKQESMPAEMRGTMALMLQNYMTTVAASCLNARLSEMAQKADCPFLQAGAQYGTYIMSRTCDAFMVYIIPKPGQDAAAVQAVMQEVERANRFGFNATEVLRARDEQISLFEKIYENRNKRKNGTFVNEYVRHFLDGDYFTDIETEFQTYKAYAQQLPAEAMSAIFKEMTASTDSNFVCLALYADKEGVVIPTADEFKNAISAAKAAQLEAYVDNVKDEPLVPQLPKPVKIKKEAAAAHGYTCWTLGNGARVFFKKTDFNESQVNVAARSFGGTNKVKEDELTNAELLSAVMSSTGIGNFTSVELEKKLAGKQVSLTPNLTETADRLDGNSTPKDLRTLFELIHLRFQKPGVDNDGYNNLVQTLRTQLQNITKNPDVAFSDSIQQTLYGHNKRVGSVIPDLDKMNYETVRRIYSERFASAGDFDFFFTGAFDTDSLRAFTEQYIATLPGVKKREKLTDCGIRPVKGDVENRFVRQMESPKASIRVIWTGEVKYDLKTAAVVNALGEILSQRYLKSIREEGSMAYSVGARASIDCVLYDSYTMQVYCPVKPEKMDSALYLMQVGIDDIAAKGVTEEELNKVKEFEIKDYNDNQRENSYWQNQIVMTTLWGKNDHDGALDAIKSVTSKDIQDFVNNYLMKQHNRVTVTMLPDKF